MKSFKFSYARKKVGTVVQTRPLFSDHCRQNGVSGCPSRKRLNDVATPSPRPPTVWVGRGHFHDRTAARVNLGTLHSHPTYPSEFDPCQLIVQTPADLTARLFMLLSQNSNTQYLRSAKSCVCGSSFSRFKRQYRAHSFVTYKLFSIS